ncbi:MAG: serine hydrolase [Acidobacteria bacterium]|nr:serine hydrolase [Acidobacteriota bacterium]
MSFLLLLTWTTLATHSTAAPAAQLTARLQALIAPSGAEVAVAFRPLDGSPEVVIDADKVFHAASTMKVPVMIELFRQAQEGTLKLDDPLPIRNEFRSIVDGSPYQLSVGDDSDREVYSNIGKTMTLRALCEAMITVSSNFATNLLIEKLDVKKVRATVKRLGAEGMQVLRGVEDQKAFDKGMSNSTTARGLMVLLEMIGRGQAVSPTADAEMIEILKRQRFNEAIPAGMPPGTPVAHKTGTITRIHHDAAIVYGPRPYVLVVLVRGIQDQKQSAALIAGISKAVWETHAR